MGFFFHCALVHLYHRYAQNVEEIFALEDLSVHTQLGLFKMLASTPKHTVLSNFERKSNRMIKKKSFLPRLSTAIERISHKSAEFL